MRIRAGKMLVTACRAGTLHRGAASAGGSGGGGAKKQQQQPGTGGGEGEEGGGVRPRSGSVSGLARGVSLPTCAAAAQTF